jgi:hypothetical protein
LFWKRLTSSIFFKSEKLPGIFRWGCWWKFDLYCFLFFLLVFFLSNILNLYIF